MQSYKRILVVVDPTAETHCAVDKAAALAQKAGAHLDLLICDYDDHYAGTRFGDSEQLRDLRGKMLQQAHDRLQALAAPIREQGLQVDVHAVFSHPLHEAISSKAQELQPDVIVKDTHYHPLLQRALFSNTDWELIRLCPFNLLLVKDRDWAPHPVILSAVDPLHIGDKPAALDHAILIEGLSLAAMNAGHLRVVHCYPVTMPAAVAGAGIAMPASIDAESLCSSVEQSHRLALDKLVENYPIEPDSIFLLPGEPRRVLITMAESHCADVVVVGAVSRSRIKQAFLGFTALHILDRLPCDLLVVKTPVA